MTDVELLKLAGKAAGKSRLEWVENEYRDGQGPLTGWYDDETETVWNSLINKADAFELMITAGIGVWDYKEWKKVVCNTDNVYNPEGYSVGEDYTDKPYIAACRAITQCAAEIAKCSEGSKP